MKRNYFLSTIIVSFASVLNAQIVYTDIVDGIPTGIDFNSDGTMEFDVSTGTNPGDYITYDSHGIDNNIHAIGTISTTDWDVPNCVTAGFVVDQTNQWEGQGDCSLDAWGGVNNTITYNQDEYIAVRFNLTGSSIYYGWIRFSMNSSGLMTYKDYAYNSTSNTSIKTGEKGSSVGILSLENENAFVIYPNPVKNSFTLNNSSNDEITEIRIVDLFGAEVKSELVANSSQYIIDVSDLVNGIYLVNLFKDENQIGIKKIIID